MKAAPIAGWCVLTGFGPELYRELTLLERDEFLQVAKKIHGVK